MGDIISGVLSGSLGNILNFLGAAGALGTGAMGLVDTTKVFGGGPSNVGFGYIKNALEPFLAPLATNSPAFGKKEILQTLRANWLNGVAMADQKAKAKSLIHLGLTTGSAVALANAAGVDPQKLLSLAQKNAEGQSVDQDEINVLGQFDVVLSALRSTAPTSEETRHIAMPPSFSPWPYRRCSPRSAAGSSSAPTLNHISRPEISRSACLLEPLPRRWRPSQRTLPAVFKTR